MARGWRPVVWWGDAIVFGATAAGATNPLFPFCIETHDAKKRTMAAWKTMVGQSSGRKEGS